jgi:hypothetical protein
MYWRRTFIIFAMIVDFRATLATRTCSVAGLAFDNAISGSTFSEHLMEVADELNRLLVSGKVPTVRVFADEDDVMSSVDPTVEPHRS